MKKRCIYFDLHRGRKINVRDFLSFDTLIEQSYKDGKISGYSSSLLIEKKRTKIQFLPSSLLHFLDEEEG